MLDTGHIVCPRVVVLESVMVCNSEMIIPKGSKKQIVPNDGSYLDNNPWQTIVWSNKNLNFTTYFWDRKCKFTLKVSLTDIADMPKIFTKLYIYQNERCFVCQGKIGVHNGSDSALRIGLSQKHILHHL